MFTLFSYVKQLYNPLIKAFRTHKDRDGRWTFFNIPIFNNPFEKIINPKISSPYYIATFFNSSGIQRALNSWLK